MRKDFDFYQPSHLNNPVHSYGVHTYIHTYIHMALEYSQFGIEAFVWKESIHTPIGPPAAWSGLSFSIGWVLYMEVWCRGEWQVLEWANVQLQKYVCEYEVNHHEAVGGVRHWTYVQPLSQMVSTTSRMDEYLYSTSHKPCPKRQPNLYESKNGLSCEISESFES
mmetsp:Transcript_12654/g.20608  ORF Transcript_12654/g.20608 Transcript_12654/m.20608 type:complete len:165 (+) Transcript_12654:914-1408(+)